MVRIDMSEYMEKHAVSRLVGSPPGYIGYGRGRPAHRGRGGASRTRCCSSTRSRRPTRTSSTSCLQILEDGRLTDSQGRTVDFRNAIIIMTSNIGAADIARNTPVGIHYLR